MKLIGWERVMDLSYTISHACFRNGLKLFLDINLPFEADSEGNLAFKSLRVNVDFWDVTYAIVLSLEEPKAVLKEAPKVGIFGKEAVVKEVCCEKGENLADRISQWLMEIAEAKGAKGTCTSPNDVFNSSFYGKFGFWESLLNKVALFVVSPFREFFDFTGDFRYRARPKSLYLKQLLLRGEGKGNPLFFEYTIDGKFNRALHVWVPLPEELELPLGENLRIELNVDPELVYPAIKTFLEKRTVQMISKTFSEIEKEFIKQVGSEEYRRLLEIG